MSLRALQNSIAQKTALLEAAETALVAGNLQITANDLEISILKDAGDLLLAVAVEYQASVLRYLNELVSHGLQDVFGPGYRVEFRESTKANQRVIDIVLIHHGLEVSVPDGCGGGVSETIAVLVQLILVYLKRDELAQFIVLDESLAHLALVHTPAMGRVLKDVGERLGLQLLVITHQADLADEADVVYTFEPGDLTSGTRVYRQTNWERQ